MRSKEKPEKAGQSKKGKMEATKLANEQEEMAPIILGNVAGLPPEIWENILSYLTTLEDYWTGINTCATWHDLLVKGVPTQLFPLVLPHLAKYLPPPTLLKSREVCKTWRSCVDGPLQEYLFSEKSWECHGWAQDTPFKHVLHFLESKYKIESRLGVVKFLAQMQSHKPSNNPFISRRVNMLMTKSPGYNLESSYEDGVKLLERFGKHIWEFTNTVPDMEGQVGMPVVILASLLPRLENLRVLRIRWAISYCDYQASTPSIISVLNFLRDEPHHQFPPLPHLTTLDIAGFEREGELEVALTEALLHCYGRQLKTFVCTGDFVRSEYIRKLTPNLKNLRVHQVTPWALKELEHLQHFPLERLQLWNNHNFTTFDLPSFIKAINCFASTLQLLHMDVDLNHPTVGWRANLLNHPGSDLSPEEVRKPFPRLVKFGGTLSSVYAQSFWNLAAVKFPSLENLEFQGVMGMAGGNDRDFGEERVERASHFFGMFPDLAKIDMWEDATSKVTLNRPR